MSLKEIQSELEKRLATLSPAIATAYENTVYAPVINVPYQRVSMLLNKPIDRAVTMDVTEDRGIFQVSLFYPIGAGRGAAQARAELIRALFKPALRITEGTTKVDIDQTPEIAQGVPDGDRYMVPVSVYWKSYS